MMASTQEYSWFNSDKNDPQKERFYARKPTGTPNTTFKGETKGLENGGDRRERGPNIFNRLSHGQMGGFTYKEVPGHWPLPFPLPYSFPKVSIQEWGEDSGWQV